MSPTLMPSTDRNPIGYPYMSTSESLDKTQGSPTTWTIARMKSALSGSVLETPSQPTFAAVAAASGNKPLTRRDLPAPPAPSSVSKKPVPAKQQV